MAVCRLGTPDTSESRLPPALRVVLLGLFAVLGIVLRSVGITILPNVTLTPGFTIPLLTGMALGPIAGLVCGLVVGVSGGLTELWLIPLLGNMALGLSTGVPSLARRRLPYLLWASLCVMSGGFFGGFLPTFAVLLFFQPIVAVASGLMDGSQAVVWAIVAVLLDKTAVQPLLQRLVDQGVDGTGNATNQGFAQSFEPRPGLSSLEQRLSRQLRELVE